MFYVQAERIDEGMVIAPRTHAPPRAGGVVVIVVIVVVVFFRICCTRRTIPTNLCPPRVGGMRHAEGGDLRAEGDGGCVSIFLAW